MTDNKLRCAMIYRLSAGEPSTILAKYDHAGQYETRSGTTHESRYGGREECFGQAVGKLINEDPPMALTESETLGGFKVVQSNQHQVVYGADGDGVCLAVITGLAYPSHIAIQMLQELYTNIISKFSSEVGASSENTLNRKAKRILSQACIKYDDLGAVSKAASVREHVDVAREIMGNNIAKQVENIGMTENMVEKADQLKEEAVIFQRNTTVLRKQMAWKNLKMTLLFSGLITVMLVVILAPVIRNAKR